MSPHNLNYKFLQQSFRLLDLPNLLINIWSYADKPKCPIRIQYQSGLFRPQKKNGRLHLLILIML